MKHFLNFMRYPLFCTWVLLSSVLCFGQAKVGNNPTTIGTSSLLELEHPNKALVITRVANTAAITNPVDGMFVYDLSSSCFKGYQNGAWSACFGSGVATVTPSTNGTGVVSAYGGAGCTGSGTINGTMTQGVAVSGVTMTLYANVTTLGTYNLSAVQNGVTFTGSGSFTTLGCQAITLTASGTPEAAGSFTWTTNSSPSGAAPFTVAAASSPSTNGTGVVSAYGGAGCTGSGTINGTMTQGVAVSGVTMTLYANVTTLGTYNLSAVQNGVTFTGSGSFTTLGCQAITLTASGTPEAAGSFTWTTNSSPSGAAPYTVAAASSPSTNGTGVVSAYGGAGCTGSGTINGTMTQGVAVSGVTMTLYADVTTLGTYNLSAVQNGVTFTGSGSFTTLGCQAITLTASGTPTASGTYSFVTNTTPTATVTATVAAPITIPATITISQNNVHFVASLYDQDYLPYTSPTGPATTATPTPADGANDPVTINVQGTITTAGVAVKIGVTCTGSGTLPAYSTTITIPASMTEDGISRDLTLSWAAQSYSAATKTINATIAAVGGTLNAKKLDVQTGIGNDVLGVLMGAFTFPYNNAGSTTTFEVRDIAGIPDKMMGVADNTGSTTTHLMLYLPKVAEDGKTWLNNNLGAHYANVNHPSFNLVAQATSATDWLAYGSLIQWGRKTDGHELITFTSGTGGTAVNGTTGTLNNAPTHALFIPNSAPPYDWRSTQDNTLWATAASANNPCPSGYRVPTDAELTNLVNAAGIANTANAASSLLKLSAAGYRDYINGTLNNNGINGLYWANGVSTVFASYRLIYGTGTASGTQFRATGASVRCIKN